MPFRLRQSPGIETVEDGGNIEEILPPSSTTQSQVLSHNRNRIFIPLQALSVIVPVYRNHETLVELHLRLKKLDLPLEILFVNDASPDSSLQELQKLAQIDPAVRILSLTKNSGQHRAVLAGLQESRGDYLATLDADLQDPPEAIPPLLQHLKTGYDAVFAGRRGLYQSRLRLLTSALFKFCLNKLSNAPQDAGMFVVLTRKMAQTIQTIPMKHPYIVSLIGLSQLPITSIPVERTQRLRGKSAYTSWMRLKLALSILYHTARVKRGTCRFRLSTVRFFRSLSCSARQRTIEKKSRF